MLNVQCELQRVATILMVISVYWSSVLSESCGMNTDNREDFNISCDIIFPNALNASWVAKDTFVRDLRIDYTCTIAGLKQVTGNLYGWGRSFDGDNLIDPIFPTASYPLNLEPTCYLGGCYIWTSPRARFPTLSIPRVTCTGTYNFYTSRATVGRSRITTRSQQNSVSSFLSYSVTLPEDSNAAVGLRPYVWIVLGVTITVLLIILLCTVCVFMTILSRGNNGQIRSNLVEREMMNHNTLEVTEHEESPTLGIHAYNFRNERPKHDSVQERTTESKRTSQEHAEGSEDMKSGSARGGDCPSSSPGQHNVTKKPTGVQELSATKTFKMNLLIALGAIQPVDTLEDISALLADIERGHNEEEKTVSHSHNDSDFKLTEMMELTVKQETHTEEESSTL